MHDTREPPQFLPGLSNPAIHATPIPRLRRYARHYDNLLGRSHETHLALRLSQLSHCPACMFIVPKAAPGQHYESCNTAGKTVPCWCSFATTMHRSAPLSLEQLTLLLVLLVCTCAKHAACKPLASKPTLSQAAAIVVAHVRTTGWCYHMQSLRQPPSLHPVVLRRAL